MPSLKEARSRMEDALEALRRDFATVRTGKATPALLDTVRVEAYGTRMPLNQVATVHSPDASLLVVQPFDKSLLTMIEKCIQIADLGLNPSNDGNVIRVPIPPLTEERRKELVKVAKKYTEECKIAIRNVRRDLNDTLKKMEKDKEISEDELKKGETDVQKLTDDFVKQSDSVFAAKEKEILEI